MPAKKSERVEISAKLSALMQKAEQGDTSALPALRLALEARPELWKHYPSLADGALAAWINLAVQSNLLLRETLERQLAELQDNLRRPGATPLEELLLARIAVSWLQVHYADVIYTQMRGKQLPLAELKAAELRLHRADLRYRAALKQLATLQRLVPAPPAPGKVEPLSRKHAQARALPSRPRSRTGPRG